MCTIYSGYLERELSLRAESEGHELDNESADTPTMRNSMILEDLQENLQILQIYR